MNALTLDTMDALVPGIMSGDQSDVSGVVRAVSDLLAGTMIASPTWQEDTEEFRSGLMYQALRADPLVERSEKSRGLDATLLDFIFVTGEALRVLPNTPERGRMIHAENISRPLAQALRWHRRQVADLILSTCASTPEPRILLLNARHARALDLVPQPVAEMMGRCLAVDADADALATIAADYPFVETRKGSMAEVAMGLLEGEEFDLIVASGAFDTFEDRVAQRAMAKLGEMVGFGGRIAVSGFMPCGKDRAFMEACLHWTPKRRTRDEMCAIACRLPGEWSGEITPDPTHHCMIAEVTRED